MATYAAPDGQPHGIAVLMMRREEAETLLAHLKEARDWGVITDNTDLSDVLDAMEGAEDNVYTLTDKGRQAIGG
jgi:hypothetical protein